MVVMQLSGVKITAKLQNKLNVKRSALFTRQNVLHSDIIIE
jgi:hypothetical protein